MSETGRIRFDQKALENHANEYCRNELKLANDLIETLRAAERCSSTQYSARTHRCVNDAERLANYFSKKNDALIEVGQLVEATSRTMLKRLDIADEHMKALLK